jgi:hypothetical protein
MSVFVGNTSTLQSKEGGGSFYIYPLKTSRWELVSKNRILQFWKLETPIFEN